MGLFKKLTDVVRSNLNTAVNAAEDPRKMIDQAITDLEEQLRASKRKQLEVATLARQTEKLVEKYEKAAQEWEVKATQALKAGNEELARAALTEKQSVDPLVDEARQTAAAQRQMTQDIGQSILALEEHLAQAKRKRAELLARLQHAQVKQRQHEAEGLPAKDHLGDTSAFDTFDRMTEKIEHTEAEVEAHQEIAALDAPPIVKALPPASQAPAVDDALAALKAKMGKG